MTTEVVDLDPFMGEPTPPENVRAVLPDGTEIPVECVYVGLQDGIHAWKAVSPVASSRLEMRVDVLPAKTTVEMVFRRISPS